MPRTPAAKEESPRVAQRLRQQHRILLDFARVAAEMTEMQRLLDQACHHAARATQVDHSKVLQFRSDKGDLLMVAGRGWQRGVVGHSRLGCDMMSPPGRAFQTRQAITIANIPEDPNYRYDAILRDHSIVSLLNAPIAFDGVVWGVLEVDSNVPDAFTEDDERFLQTFAVTLGLAVRNHLAQAERDRQGEELGRRLLQSDTYMREQNHRVRNYFQMILSVIGARSQRAATSDERHNYAEVMERVTAIGLAHDLLTVQSGQSMVNAAVYLDALCSGLERSRNDVLKIERDLEPIPLRPDRAVPLGLILNELVTNAIKYALDDHPDAFISVRFMSSTGAEGATLVVRDTGPGMGQPRPGSLGLRLVRSLAAQLSGHIEIETSSAGTTVTLTFPAVV